LWTFHSFALITDFESPGNIFGFSGFGDLILWLFEFLGHLLEWPELFAKFFFTRSQFYVNVPGLEKWTLLY
jgi:hypothetical protein